MNRTMSRVRRLLGPLRIALVSLASFGCAGLMGPGEPPFETVWRVVEIDGVPVPRLPDNRAPTLQLDGEEARASGFTGCNRMTGSFVLEGDALSFGLLATTRMACEALSSQVEMGYLQSIESVTRWRRRDDGLELMDLEGRVRMRLEPAGRIDAPLPP
jgi:heat shock protein HslJ